MTDKEIIKALEICILGDCSGCNCKCGSVGDCRDTLNKHSLDLINRLQADKKSLEERNVILKWMVDRQQAEIERLKNDVFCIANERDAINAVLNSAVTEAVKELFTKVNEIQTEIYNKHIFGDNDLDDVEKDAVINFSDDVTYALDELKKEMVGEDK